MTPSSQALSGRCLAVCGETAGPRCLAFSPPTPKPPDLSWMASVPDLFLQGRAGLAGLLRTRVLALSGTPWLSVWQRLRIYQGSAVKSFLLQVSEGSSRVFYPPASFSPQADRNQNAELLRDPPTARSAAPIAAQASSHLLRPPLPAGPSSQRQAWLDPGPLGEPRVPAQRLPARRLISQWPLSPGRELATLEPQG